MRTQPRVSMVVLMAAVGCATANEMGRRLGLSRGSVQQYKKRGIPVFRADVFALALDDHPAIIWGDDFYQELESPGEPGE